MKRPAKSKNPGPKPDRVKIDDDWESAVSQALKKKRPKGGWPKHINKKNSGKKSQP